MKEKGLLISMLCVVVIVMAVAFAAFSTNLQINGTASIASTWNVAFDGNNSSCSDGSAIIVSGTTATLSVGLESPGDAVTCTLTVKNSGTLDAKLKSITSVPEGSAPITFTVTPAPDADLSSRAVLSKNGGTETIVVVISYDKNVEGQPEETVRKALITATYEQYFAA